MGHTVHEGDDSLMSFCTTSGLGPPGPFFLAVRVSRTHDADVLAMRLSGEHSGGSATWNPPGPAPHASTAQRSGEPGQTGALDDNRKISRL